MNIIKSTCVKKKKNVNLHERGHGRELRKDMGMFVNYYRRH